MKKSIYKILSSILSVVLLASGCNSELAIMDQTNPDAIVSSTFETTKTLDNSSSVDVFRTQVTQAFVEMIKDEEVWESIQPLIIESEPGLEVFEVSDFTIKDDIMMGRSQLENVSLGGMSLAEHLSYIYEELFPESNYTFDQIEEVLPSLRFSFPNEALTSFSSWSDAGYPTVSSSLEYTDLEVISSKEVITLIGEASIALLDEIANLDSDTYRLYVNNEPEGEEDFTLAIIKIMELEEAYANGAIYTKNSKGEENIETLSLELNELGDFEAQVGGSESFLINRNKYSVYSAPVPVPSCNYILCSELSTSNTVITYQNLANETCETYTPCLPCCDNIYAVGPNWMLMNISPTKFSCKKIDVYQTVLTYTIAGLGTTGGMTVDLP